jgi:LacI family transcriptional regulator
MNRWPFCILQIFLVIAWREDGRLAIVNWRHRSTIQKVAQAMAFIRDHSSEGIKVPRVVSAVAISRSGLETRFTSALGYSIHTAIGHTKPERVRRLVTETDMRLKQIASESGVKSVQHMTILFVKSFGQTPGKYRRTSTI